MNPYLCDLHDFDSCQLTCLDMTALLENTQWDTITVEILLNILHQFKFLKSQVQLCILERQAATGS